MISGLDPPLHERVYQGFKDDYLAGHFVPGKRIDIQHLATRYRTSKTPVREAAFIMVGEGLLAHHADGGFLVPVLAPEEHIELLDWHMQLVISALSTLKESAVRRALTAHAPSGVAASPVSVALRATEIFSSLAQATGNQQTMRDVRRLNELLHYSRIQEASEPVQAEKELAVFASGAVRNFHKATRRRIEAYHMRKISHQIRMIRST